MTEEFQHVITFIRSLNLGRLYLNIGIMNDYAKSLYTATAVTDVRLFLVHLGENIFFKIEAGLLPGIERHVSDPTITSHALAIRIVFPLAEVTPA